MSAAVALQAVLSGLATGAIYGLVALGFSLVYRLTRVLALSHGDLTVGALFVAVLAVLGATPVAVSPDLGRSIGLTLLVLAAGATLAAAVYAAAVRPFLSAPGSGRRGDVMGWVAGTIAAGLLIREVLGLLLVRPAYAVPDPLHLDALSATGVFRLPAGAVLPVRVLGVLAVGIVVGVATERLLVRGRFGRAVRAVADDPVGAALLGIDAGRVVLGAFVVAGLLAGLAGLLDAPGRSVSIDDGVVLGLKGVAAALLGRLGSLRGALVGGLVLGELEALAVNSSLLGAAYLDVLPLALLVVLLALRPEGLRSGRPRPALEP